MRPAAMLDLCNKLRTDEDCISLPSGVDRGLADDELIHPIPEDDIPELEEREDLTYLQMVEKFIETIIALRSGCRRDAISSGRPNYGL